MSIYDLKTGALKYSYRIDTDATGGKTKYWVVRIRHSLVALDAEQRLSRHDNAFLADRELTRLEREDMNN